jgi:hypothetical protein
MALIDDISDAWRAMRREHLRTKAAPLFIGNVGSDAPFELTEMPRHRQAPMPKTLRIGFDTFDELRHGADGCDARLNWLDLTFMGCKIEPVHPDEIEAPGWEWTT